MSKKAVDFPLLDLEPKAPKMSAKVDLAQIRLLAPILHNDEALPDHRRLKLYLAPYVRQFYSSPLCVRMLTSGMLSAVQELSASWLANSKHQNKMLITSMVVRMALHGALVKAPVSQALAALLQRCFARRTSLGAKLLQFLASQLVIAPVQNVIFLVSIAVFTGARTWSQIRATVRTTFPRIMKITWVVSPLALAFAQTFLAEQTWPLFFNIIALLIGTYQSTIAKKRREV